MKTWVVCLLLLAVQCFGGEGFILVISGPSGAGKSELIKRLRAENDLPITFSVSSTTRAPRGSEINGKEYFFLERSEF